LWLQLADKRKHRGPHPRDATLFGQSALPALRAAAADLAWLLGRGYAEPSSIKIVGDRYRLVERQRTAVKRCVCTTTQLQSRASRQLPAEMLAGKEIWIDGFNVLVTLESLLGQAVILRGFDGCHRDMASMHGTYRKILDTPQAIELAGQSLAALSVGRCRWLLDSPVSNSGRLKTLLRQIAISNHWQWDVDLVDDPDPILSAEKGAIVVTADSMILDNCGRWFSLAGQIIETSTAAAWIVDLRTED